MRIYNMIPGKMISEEFIMNRIIELIDSVEYNKWIELNEKVYSLDFLNKMMSFM